MHRIPGPVAAGVSLSLLAILFGFVLGGVFGSLESSLKKHLDDSGTAVLETVYGGDVDVKDAVVAKAWTYMKRAHLHGGSIGTTALAAILALILLCPLGQIAKLSALALGAGAVIYPMFWLFAGLTAPGLGSTSIAKESLSFIAIPGAGLCVLGLCGTIFVVAKTNLFAPTEA